MVYALTLFFFLFFFFSFHTLPRAHIPGIKVLAPHNIRSTPAVSAHAKVCLFVKLNRGAVLEDLPGMKEREGHKKHAKDGRDKDKHGPIEVEAQYALR